MDFNSKLDEYYKEELTMALAQVAKQYPAVFIHFFMAEVDPIWYKQYMDNLGKEDAIQNSNPT